jgi:hypothetical protein
MRMSGSVTDTPHRTAPAAAALAGLLLAGCAYSFSSGLPPHIKSVAVPVFANETSEFGIAEEITDRLVAALVRDATLRVVQNEEEASSVLIGTVKTYSEEPSGYTRDEKVERYTIRITVTVRFYDRVKDATLWESERVFGSALYPNEGPEQRATGLEQAIGQLVDEVLAGVVAGW